MVERRMLPNASTLHINYTAIHTTDRAHTTTPGGQPKMLPGDRPLIWGLGLLRRAFVGGRTCLALVFVCVSVLL